MYPTPQARNPYGMFDSRRKALTFIEELSKELLDLKPRLNKRNKLFEYDVYEYDKGIYVVDVRNILGLVRGSGENVLTSQFWGMIIWLIRNIRVDDVVRTDGVIDYYGAGSDYFTGGRYISYGTSTVPESFTDYQLKSRTGAITPSLSVGYLSDRVRVTYSGTIPSSASELGIEVNYYGTVWVLLARKTGSWSANQAVAWYIDFLQPWVRAIGDIWYGLNINTNVSVVRVDGATITARTGGVIQVGSAYLVASGNLVSWSPILYGIINAFSLNNYYADLVSTRYIRATFINGLYSPANDIAVNTIGLYFPIYDSNGITQTVCILVQPLSSPITLYASRNNLIVLRIIAF
jgi:hypothetical protein